MSGAARLPAGRRAAGVAAGLAVIAVLVAVDAAFGDRQVVIGITVVAPFVTAMLASVRDTALVAALAVAVTAASGTWNDNFGDAGYDIRLAGVLAGAVFAVLSARVRERDVVARRRLELLAAVAEVADGQLTLHATVDRIVDLMVPRVSDMAIVDAMQGGAFTRLAVRVDGPGASAFERAVMARGPAGGPPEQALREGAPRLLALTDASLREMARDDDDLALLRALELRCAIVVPLRARGRVLGALTLVQGERSGRGFDEDDLGFAQVLSGRVALALDNAGLFSELESMEAQLTAALGSLTDAVTVQNRDGRLLYVNQAAARMMGFEDVSAMLATPPTEYMARNDVFLEDGSPFDLASLPGRRVLAGLPAPPLTLRVVDRDTGDERWRLVKASPVLERDGRPQLAVNVIEDITDIKRAELAQRLLVQAGEALAGSLDVDLTLQQVAELAVPELADWCGVSLPEPDGSIRQVAVAHVDPAKVRLAREYNRRFPARVGDGGGTDEVLRTGRSQLIPELPDELLEASLPDPEQRELIRSIGMRSAMLVPMPAAGVPIGVITFVSAESGRRFGDNDLALAQELARRAGTAVHNARLYAERTHIARTLQTGLLPDAVPDIPGLAIATLYRPAGEENWVGGDFYDAFPVRGGWMVVVGDVAGRGPEAAALTALARYTLRAAAMLADDPLDALGHLNRELLARPGTSLVTIACAVVEGGADADSRARVACAGHPPVLRVRADSVSPVGRFGPMLGAFADGVWEAVEVHLDDGDLLVLYTDGVIDTRGRSERFGERRLHDTVRGAADAGEAVRRIERALQAFESGDQADDTAVVAVRCTRAAGGQPAGAGAATPSLARTTSSPGLGVPSGSTRPESQRAPSGAPYQL